MKQDGIDFKKGDRIWVQSNDHYVSPSHLRLAEVIRLMQVSACCNNFPYVVVKYLDAGNIVYECVSLERVKGLCDCENTNY